MNLYGNMSDQKAIAGLLYGMNPRSTVTYPANGVVDYGKGLFLADGSVSNAKGDAGVFVGVAVFHQSSFKNERGCYTDKEAVNVLDAGEIWCKLADGVEPTVGANAYVTDDGEITTADGAFVGLFKSEAEDGLVLVDVIKVKGE